MGFHTPEGPVEAVGYVAAFSAEQVVKNLGSEYDAPQVHELVSDAFADLQHHSEGVYEVTVTVRKVKD